MKISTDHTIGEIVAADYRTATVFKAHGIDFCCKGGRSVSEVCESKNLDPQVLLEAVRQAAASTEQPSADYHRWPLDLLADYVEKKHHRYVATKSPELVQYLDKLCRVHGDHHPELFEIRDEFAHVASELAAHMQKEEMILFPFIRKLATEQQPARLMFGTVQNPIDMMMHEHVVEGERLARIAELSKQYTPPADGCTTYRVTFAMLKEFEDDLHLHIHLENNIMFPRAIEREKQIAIWAWHLSMETSKPLKRHPGLQPLSRDHHHGLLLAWKIRKGLASDIVPERIKAYADWFFKNHLSPHFEAEERHVFPLLGSRQSHPMVRRAMREHGRLRRLFAEQDKLPLHLSLIEEELTAHIRYEERVLFEAVQAVASPEQLAVMEQLHEGLPFVDDWGDRFWEKAP